MAKTLEQQLKCAQARARTAHLTITCIGFDARGFSAKVTSERDPNTEYRITRDQATGCLVCTCPATVICKHLGTVINAGASYHSNSKRPEDLPYTPNPNRPDLDDDPEPEPPAPSPAPAHRCHECGCTLRVDQERYCDWCDGIMDFLKTNAYQPTSPEPDPDPAPLVAYDTLDGQLVEVLVISEIPLLMDIATEVAIVEGLMEAEGFTWSEAAQTWVRKPALAEVAR